MRWTEEALQAFRHHRHDVLNSLQVIRGYIQLNRPTDAIEALDRLSNWTKSMTLVQVLGSSADGWFTAMVQCPHVCLTQVQGILTLTPSEDQCLASTWLWLEEQAALTGTRSIGASCLRMTNPMTASTIVISISPIPSGEPWCGDPEGWRDRPWVVEG